MSCTEAQLLAAKRHREKHREEIRAKARERYYSDPRYGPDKQRQWRAENPEMSRATVNRYRSRHPIMSRVHNNKRRARTMDSFGQWTVDEWISLKARFEFKCLMCGRKEPDIKLTFDHVIPLSQGGMNTIDNGQPLCQPCNSKKHARIVDFRSRPW